MKRKSIALTIILLAVLLVLPVQALAGGAKDTVEAQINKMLTKMKTPEFKALDRGGQIKEISTVIDEVFDWQELSRRTLGREWRKFTPEQQTEFVSLFQALLQDIYQSHHGLRHEIRCRLGRLHRVARILIDFGDLLRGP